MARPSIEPVSPQVLPEFAAFLHQHLDSRRSAREWADGLAQGWSADAPNHGFVVRDNGAIVGGIGAYYADRLINGRPEKFCNITSWCVLESHRPQSMRLAMAVVGQKGYHFTDFSPTQVVGATLKFLKFRPIDERQAVTLNLPWPLLGDGLRIVSRPTEIEACLTGAALQAWRDHSRFPWLRQLLLGRPGAWCHVVYKRRAFKGLPAASILHASDPALLQAGWRRLCRHLLARGLISSHVECRWLPQAPWPSAIRSGFNAKLFLSETLGAEHIDYLYSESVALDL